MATTKKTTRTTTKKAVEKNETVDKNTFEPIPVLSDIVNDAEVEIAVEKEVSRKKFELDDMITCKCVKGNRVIYVSTKTGQRYEWSGFGDLCDVMYQDLLALKSSKSSYLFDPLIIICDEDLSEQWGKDFGELYKSFLEFEDPDYLFSLSANEIREKLSNAPAGLKDTVKTTACKKVKKGELDQLSVIRVIDEVLGTDLQSLLVIR